MSSTDFACESSKSKIQKFAAEFRVDASIAHDSRAIHHFQVLASNHCLFSSTTTSYLSYSRSKMADPEKDLAKLSKEQEKEDAAFLDNLEKESKEFDKVSLSSMRRD